MNNFDKKIFESRGKLLESVSIDTVQVNIGTMCNQSCAHCHLSASSESEKMMSPETMKMVIKKAEAIKPRCIEITGGAPELHPEFVTFVKILSQENHKVLVRTNLTVLLELGKRTLPDFYRKHRIHLVASLPCYDEENVTIQRGEGVYEKSITALKMLNSAGYGKSSELQLDLVYNPAGDFLPPEQPILEKDYREELHKRHGVLFSNLLTITNMPVGRFRKILCREGKEKKYLQFLIESFNAHTVEKLMCLTQINIGWDGLIYDCDFNLALGIPVNHSISDHISTLNINALLQRRIMTGNHCFGCTAGTGSSCGGALL